MVRIDKVYTRGGDLGETSLIGGQRVAKNALRIECYGTVDELNAVLGLVCTALESSQAAAKLTPIVSRVQSELFNLGAELATPEAERRSKQPAVEARHVAALEAEIDELNEALPDLTSFILPGGGSASAHLHLARTVCRRAERHAVALAREAEVGDQALTYLNRLSDAFFVFGRWAAKADGRSEPLWQPEKT